MAEVRIGLLIIILFLMLTGCDGQSDEGEETIEYDEHEDEISYFFESDETRNMIINWEFVVKIAPTPKLLSQVTPHLSGSMYQDL